MSLSPGEEGCGIGFGTIGGEPIETNFMKWDDGDFALWDDGDKIIFS